MARNDEDYDFFGDGQYDDSRSSRRAQNRRPSRRDAGRRFAATKASSPTSILCRRLAVVSGLLAVVVSATSAVHEIAPYAISFMTAVPGRYIALMAAVLIGITLILVIAAVILMGFALSWLLLVDLGTDPCTLLNQTISTRLGISIGNWQALFNTVLLIFVIIFGGRNLGFGTLANMFLVGYSIDFFSWIWAKVLPADLFTSMGVRIAVLIPALILFILAASFYMDVDMGTAPYDAVSFIISTHLPNVSFRVIRIVYDFVVTAIAVLLGGKLGIVTVLMVITLGPVIEWLGNIMKQHLNIFDD